ncbi:uncharacterized protein CBL_20281, partial [Carabus blaptoides fortunei]
MKYQNQEHQHLKSYTCPILTMIHITVKEVMLNVQNRYAVVLLMDQRRPRNKLQESGVIIAKCDTPKITVDHMLKNIAETHPDIDYILWTGDLPPHDVCAYIVWNQTREENLKVHKDTVEQMSTRFPGTPIFPALGNHEAVSVNSFPAPFVDTLDRSISWLYDELDTRSPMEKMVTTS